jgi:hypothetical protein
MAFQSVLEPLRISCKVAWILILTNAVPVNEVLAAQSKKPRPVEIPKEIIQTLKGDESVARCLVENVGVPHNLRARLLNLTGHADGEILVHGINRCLCGANNCVHWIFRKIASTYELILEVRAIQDIEVKKTRTNGYRDLVTWMHGSAYDHDLSVYKFNGRKYERTECLQSSYSYIDSEGRERTRKRPLITPVQCGPD